MLFWGLHLLIVASVCTTEGGCAGDNDSAYWHSPVFTLAGTVRYGTVRFGTVRYGSVSIYEETSICSADPNSSRPTTVRLRLCVLLPDTMYFIGTVRFRPVVKSPFRSCRAWQYFVTVGLRSPSRLFPLIQKHARQGATCWWTRTRSSS